MARVENDNHVEKLLGHKMVDEINSFLDVVVVTNFALPILVVVNKWPGLKWQTCWEVTWTEDGGWD